MAEYEPPYCEEAGRRHFATVHLHIDTAKYPDRPAVVFLCESHLRKRVSALRAARVEFEQHQI